MLARSRRESSRRFCVARLCRAATVESLEYRRLLNAAIVVNTTQDETIVNSTTSLREAITVAESTPGDDTITFDPTVFNSGSLHTITLTSTLELTGVDGKIDINGPGSSVVEVSGNSANRVFLVDGPFMGSINDMAIDDGRVAGAGAGINNIGTLTLNNDLFDGNEAIGTTGSAGDATTPGGTGGDALGGAIDNHAVLDVEVCTFDANEVFGGGGGSGPDGAGDGGNAKGAAIYTSGPLTVDSSTFENNEAVGGVAGGSIGADNSATSGEAAGADIGIGVFIPIVSITKSTFSFSVCLGGQGPTANTTFAAGQGGDAEGGSIYSDTTSFTLDTCTFTSTQADGGKGGYYGGTGTGGQAGDASGGALYLEGKADVENCSFNNCEAFGGASGDGTVSGPAGDGSGGAIFYEGTTLTLNGGTFTQNQAIGGSATNTGSTGSARGGNANGGAIDAVGGGTADVTTSTFSSNSATGGSSAAHGGGNAAGGALFGGATMLMDTCDFDSNTAQGGNAGTGTTGVNGAGAFGGALLIENEIDIYNTTISNNQAIGGNGGDGTAGNGGSGGGGLGGAIYQGELLLLENTTIYGNSAIGGTGGDGTANGGNGGGALGGAIRMDNTTLNTVNVTIASNTVTGGTGGGGATAGSNGSSAGGGIEESDIANLTNTIVSDNSAATGPDLHGDFTLDSCLISTPATDYNVLSGSSNNHLDATAGLGSLGDNGGPTPTMLPQPGSNAIDKGDSTAAINALLVTDQRGVGFPRIVGSAVDIGAVEVGVPMMSVTGNGKTITNGDSTASSLDNTDFGTAKLGTPIDRTFVIHNAGSAPLNLGFISLPLGFSVLTPFTSPVNPGDTTSVTIRFNPGSAGAFGGQVQIANNANNTLSTYTFTIGATALGSTIRVNFQPATSEVPSGYLLDSGSVFGGRGNGFSYGWDQSAATFSRERNAISDQREDTLIHMELFGNRTWNIAVPNGTYSVHLVAGDPSFTDSVYKINVEGVLTVNGTPSTSNHFLQGTKTVTVSDGELTISNASGSVNDKLDYVEITPTSPPPPPPPPTIKINFETPTSATPSGFFADTGSIYGSRGNGQTYGWDQSASSFSRDRNSKLSPDQQHDTFIHTELYGTRTWNIAVPNGKYQVDLVAGDSDYIDSVYKYNVEGVLALSGTPTSGNHWIEGVVTVNVSDGKLTVTNAAGSVNNKIDYIVITPM